jgi:hypothetical protein
LTDQHLKKIADKAVAVFPKNSKIIVFPKLPKRIRTQAYAKRLLTKAAVLELLLLLNKTSPYATKRDLAKTIIL